MLKTQVVKKITAEPFSLLETIRYDSGNDSNDGFEDGERFWLIDEHLARLESSATYFNYPFDRQQLLSALESEVAYLTGFHRVRLLLDQDGTIHLESFAIDDEDIGSGAVVTLADGRDDGPVDESNIFLYHKTTNRSIYQHYLEQYPQYDDVILLNRKGEVTEGCSHNLIVRLDGVDYTPPIQSGLLAGTLRARLIAQGELVERVLYPEDLLEAESFSLINSVRGVRAAILK